MDHNGLPGMRDWTYYEHPLKATIGLQLMPSVATERDTKPSLPNGIGFLHHHLNQPEPPVSMDISRDYWFHHAREPKNYHHAMPMNPTFHPHPHHIPTAEPSTHTLQMLQPPDPPKDDNKLVMIDERSLESRNESPPKKRSQSRSSKSPKSKKPKKAAQLREDINGSMSQGKAGGKKNTGLVINGIDLDLSEIPTPVCSCSGMPQQCYRWGVGGWQSACCTTSISMYPLPMSTKRKGARIAGRKMSQGAFKKVLEKLAGEGHNLSYPIDLRPFWAKHGTNKFVTIR